MAESEEEKRKRFVDEYNAKVDAGEPLVTYEAHSILKIGELTSGEVAFDFAFARSPDNRAVVARLILPPEAAQTLKAWLVANGNIPDGPPPTRGPRSNN